MFSKTFSFRGSSAKKDVPISPPKSTKVNTKPVIMNTLPEQEGKAHTPAVRAGTSTAAIAHTEDDSSGDDSVNSAFDSTITTKETTGSAAAPITKGCSATGGEHIKVAVRVRPLLPNEKDIAEKKTWEWNSNSIQLLESDTNVFNPHSTSVKQAYTFDHLFEPESTNNHIFEAVVKKIVRSSMEGFHGSVFTYGQTSSGKTFTMNGDKGQPGIIPQAIAECFEAVQSMPGRDFILRVSYLEVYNEQIKDLLSMEPVPVRIQHDPKRGTVLTGVKELVVLNTQQVLAHIKSGEAHRHVGSTDMNEKSSRAHTLFKIIIESTSSDKKEPVKVSSLYLVDLAGSESAKMTNSKGERAREAKHINQSLLTLSTIIQRLSEDRSGGKGGGRSQHLPYRDSKLTRILEPALDGNAQIGIICTVSPTAKCVEETNNTLKFASRAKLIKMSAKLNETLDDKTLLRVYKEEIEQLRVRLRELETQTRLQGAIEASSAREGGGRSLHRRSVSNESIADIEELAREADEDDANLMLQMITEMERLILRADGSKTAASSAASPRRPRLSEGSNPGTTTGRLSSGSVASAEGRDTLRKKKTAGRSSNDHRDADLIDVRATVSALKHRSKSTSRSARECRSSSAHMLSLIVEATDSNDLVRLDTLDEFDFSGRSRSRNSEEEEEEEEEEDEEEEETSGSEPEPEPCSSEDEAVRVVESLDDLLMSSDDNFAHQYSGYGADLVGSGSLEMFDMEISEDDRAALAVAECMERLLLRVEGRPVPQHVPEQRHSATYYKKNPKLSPQKEKPSEKKRKEQQAHKTRIPRPASSSVSSSHHQVLQPSLQCDSFDEAGPDGLMAKSSVTAATATATAAATATATATAPVAASGPLVSWDEFDSYDTADDIRHSLGTASEPDREHLPDLNRDSATNSAGSLAAMEAEGVEDDSVLLGVSKMLLVLKGHVSKARGRLLPPAHPAGDLASMPSSASARGIANGGSVGSSVGAASAPTSPTKRLDLLEAAKDGLSPGLKRTGSDGSMLLKINEKFDYERLKLDFRLKEADNRFLQEELENKDKMLTMLTEGLKEVEQSQTQWLTANHDLSYELEKALYQNKLLKAEMARLKDQVLMLELEKQHPHIPSPGPKTRLSDPTSAPATPILHLSPKSHHSSSSKAVADGGGAQPSRAASLSPRKSSRASPAASPSKSQTAAVATFRVGESSSTAVRASSATSPTA